MARNGNRRRRPTGGGNGNENNSHEEEEREEMEIISRSRHICPLKLRDVHLPKFDGNNYNLWTLQVRPHLISMRLKEFMEDGDEGDVRFIDTLPAHEYEELDQAVMAVLLRSLAPTILPRVVGAKKAKDVWHLLELEFKGSERVRGAYLEMARKEYEEIKMKEGETLLDYYGRFVTTITKLRECGEFIGQGQVNRKLLRSMAKSFQGIVLLLQNKDNVEEIPIQELLGTLKAYEVESNIEKKVVPEISNLNLNEETVLAAQSQSQNQNQKKVSGNQNQNQSGGGTTL